MSIITLTTDLGQSDYYVAAVKGSILKETPNTKIIDITHNIPAFNMLKAAVVIKNCYRDFPDNSIHIIGINAEASMNSPHVAIYHNNHYFIGADNGMFALIFDTPPQKVVELPLSESTDMLTFPTKDVFVKAACALIKGQNIEEIGKAKNNLVERMLFRAVPEQNIIKGMAIYIDHYGNVITNISQKLFNEFGKGRKFTIFLRSKEYEINEISFSYNETYEGERVALFSSSKHLEIAINKGNASKLLGIKENDIIRVEFYD